MAGMSFSQWATIGSTALKAYGAMSAGESARQASRFEARQLQRKADARYAQGTREAHEARREGEIVASDARAAMAAGGGTTTSPGAIRRLGRIESEGEYNALAALYSAGSDAAGLRRAARARIYEGTQSRRASRISAMGTVIQGVSTLHKMGTFGKKKKKPKLEPVEVTATKIPNPYG